MVPKAEKGEPGRTLLSVIGGAITRVRAWALLGWRSCDRKGCRLCRKYAVTPRKNVCPTVSFVNLRVTVAEGQEVPQSVAKLF